MEAVGCWRSSTGRICTAGHCRDLGRDRGCSENLRLAFSEYPDQAEEPIMMPGYSCTRIRLTRVRRPRMTCVAWIAVAGLPERHNARAALRHNRGNILFSETVKLQIDGDRECRRPGRSKSRIVGSRPKAENTTSRTSRKSTGLELKDAKRIIEAHGSDRDAADRSAHRFKH